MGDPQVLPRPPLTRFLSLPNIHTLFQINLERKEDIIESGEHRLRPPGLSFLPAAGLTVANECGRHQRPALRWQTEDGRRGPRRGRRPTGTFGIGCFGSSLFRVFEFSQFSIFFYMRASGARRWSRAAEVGGVSSSATSRYIPLPLVSSPPFSLSTRNRTTSFL